MNTFLVVVLVAMLLRDVVLVGMLRTYVARLQRLEGASAEQVGELAALTKEMRALRVVIRDVSVRAQRDRHRGNV